MSKRKQALMYEFFGKADGICKDCEHYGSYKYHNRTYRKCDVYGLTNSEASDWAGKWQACGLYPDEPYDGTEIIRFVHGGKPKEPIEIEGQMVMEGIR